MWLKSVRCVTVVLGFVNLAVMVLSGIVVVSASQGCTTAMILPFVVVLVSCTIRLLCMFGTAVAQQAMAYTIVNSSPTDEDDAVFRRTKRMRYKRWLWWTRFGMITTVLQLVGGTYLMWIMVKYIFRNGKSRDCFLGTDPTDDAWERSLLVLLSILVCFLVTLQCIAGSDVLKWRSFYATHDNAWKAHYRELFDYGIREALCCLGRAKYLSALENDEIYSVARLLGDLVAYRASGTGHLEFLAGLALLQRHRQAASSYKEFPEAPEERIREAAAFHQYAEAAYTGPLLDFGRNPILFPCAWLNRQGVLTPWTRKRRPVLEGDNWWRGHAAAFLKYVKQSPETLRRGRVNQVKCEAAYFIVVLHHLRSVIISVRGTETPEDLITDGLCRECALSVEDLDGVINCDHLDTNVKQSVISSFPHYGHSGIVEAARELFLQVDGQPGGTDNDATGFLSSLLSAGCECDGYNLRIVGHSLGGAIASLLGLRLYRRYPKLHVYAYGTLPCVDSIIAEACSDFVTSIVYGDEFSARLSVNSIMRLRAAAITSLSQDSSADSAMICKLARRVLHISKYNMNREQAVAMTIEDRNQHMNRKHYKYAIKGGVFLCSHAVSCMLNMPNHHRRCRNENSELSSDVTLQAQGVVSDEKGSAFTAGSGDELDREFLFQDENETDLTDNPDNPGTSNLRDNSNAFSNRDIMPNDCSDIALSCEEDPVSEFMHAVPSPNEASSGDPPEVYLPGLIIHIVRQQRSLEPLWKSWRISERQHDYKAYIANRENFKDIIVSPYMFLDHLPWRSDYAMRRVLEARKVPVQLDEPSMV